jgi:hypothetical protein
MFKTLKFALVLLFCLSSFSLAQETTGNIEGYIQDDEGDPLADVEIVIKGSNLQGSRGSTTDNNGYFIIYRIPAGQFNINISSVSYQPVTYEDITVRLGATTTLGIIQLNKKTIEIPEVVVYDKKSIIDPTSTTTGGALSYKTFDALPTDRNYLSMITLIPQVNESYLGDKPNIAGSTGPENIYYIDGTNVTNVENASSSVNLPYNFIKEVQIKSGGYQAEYGRALGGIINVITQSGSNEFHGNFFSSFTNNILGGERRPDLEIAKLPSFSSYDLGFSLGGPIVRNKFWFYAAYNQTFDIENVELPTFGEYKDKKTSYLFAGKLSWQASQNTNFVLSAFGDPFTYQRIDTDLLIPGWTIVNKDYLFRQWDEGGYNISLNGSHIINNKILIEASASFFDHLTRYYPGGNFTPQFYDYVTQTISGSYGSKLKHTSIRKSLNSSVTLLLGEHSLKAGLQYEDNSFHSIENDYPSGNQIRKYNDSSYTVYLFSADATVKNHVLSAFLQDSWMITKNLTLNAGLRWDAQYFIASNGEVGQSITDEFQPRVGIIFQSGQIGSQKIFASYGRFYEQIPLYMLTQYYDASGKFLFINYDHNPLVNPSGGDTTNFLGSIVPRIPDLKGQYFDEYTLGYESEIFHYLKLTLKGTYRHLLQVVEDGVDPNTNEYVIGNPGSANMSFFPELYRIYKSFEITFQKLHKDNFDFMISYVLSRNYGNYSGLFDFGRATVNQSPLPDLVEQIPNSDGLLPNDRTHVFKFSGAYTFSFGLTLGTSFFWESGTPLTNFGRFRNSGYSYFITPRGSAGRTPSVWDLNFRLTYNLGNLFNSELKPKIKLDLLHLFSQRTPVDYDQTHYYGQDANGQPSLPNSDFLNPISYQPPFTARIGLEVEF